METIKEAWTGILNYLQNQNDISEVAFNVWISCIEPYTIEDGNVVVFVQTSFQRKIINEHYQNKLCEAFNHVLGLPLGLKILSRDELSRRGFSGCRRMRRPRKPFWAEELGLRILV